MKELLAVVLAAVALPAFPSVARAQNLDDIFRKVNPAVVVVRSKGRDVGAAGITRFSETGSGFLISTSGRVMTAAHVVNGMDEITVEGVAGEVVRATIVSSDAAADISLLQLERVTSAMRVARIGDSAYRVDTLTQLHARLSGRDFQHAPCHHVARLVLSQVFIQSRGNKLLDAQSYLPLVRVDSQDLGLDRLSQFKRVLRMVDTLVGADLAHVDHTLDALGKLHEGAEFGNAGD